MLPKTATHEYYAGVKPKYDLCGGKQTTLSSEHWSYLLISPEQEHTGWLSIEDTEMQDLQHVMGNANGKHDPLRPNQARNVDSASVARLVEIIEREEIFPERRCFFMYINSWKSPGVRNRTLTTDLNLIISTFPEDFPAISTR